MFQKNGVYHGRLNTNARATRAAIECSSGSMGYTPAQPTHRARCAWVPRGSETADDPHRDPRPDNPVGCANKLEGPTALRGCDWQEICARCVRPGDVRRTVCRTTHPQRNRVQSRRPVGHFAIRGSIQARVSSIGVVGHCRICGRQKLRESSSV